MSEEKRIAGDYEIIQSVHIGDREIVVGENQADTDGLPYLVAYYESNAIIGRYYDAVGSNDFPEIMEIYGQRIMEQAQKTRAELSKPKMQGIDNSPITAEGCTPISYDDDLNGKVIVIKPEVLRPEYRRATSQLKLCTGGFGAYPHSRGSAVFCTEIYTGRQSRFERRDMCSFQLPFWSLATWACGTGGGWDIRKSQAEKSAIACTLTLIMPHGMLIAWATCGVTRSTMTAQTIIFTAPTSPVCGSLR